MKKIEIFFTLTLCLFVTAVIASCQFKASKKTVVVYVCVDQVYAEPVLKAFEAKTGIKALAVYDVEATKTSGMVNRLIAEKARPQADVFWNNEFSQTALLKNQGVLSPYRGTDDYWVSLGGRARAIIVNKDLVAPEDYPDSVYDLLDPKWPAEKIAISYPIFGTSATQAAAMYALLGPEKAREFYEGIKKRGVRVVDGNSVVKDLVSGGQLIWGLTDSDDAFVAIQEGKNVAMIFPDQETIGTLIIPATVSLVSGAPHPQEGSQLIDFLLQPETTQMLVQAGLWLEDLTAVKNLDASFSDVMQQAQVSREEMKKIFVR